ncbi:MAG: molecular chaperone HtpG [Ignavibacteria bacterium]|jgi:molecular chaperone HtpG|nr:molecular chaperone HtpG [Ignavibacteria bacterium]
MENSQTQQFEFKAEMKQLLHLIIHSLYTHPEIFIRELISNGSDALNKLRFHKLTDSNILSPDLPLSIHIRIDKDAATFSLEDSGIGMTKDELVANIGTIASSGTVSFLEQLKQTPNMDLGQLIGHFGVGFYSVFMVTDEVMIETRHYATDSQGYKWVSRGEDSFTIEEIEREQRGTTISFKLKDEFKQFAEEYAVRNAINKFSNFVDFPIYINDVEVNRVSAIWHKKKEDITDEELNEFYKFISNDYQNPLEHLVLNIEGNINFKAILFIPTTAPTALFRDVSEKSLQLYVNRVFIQDDAKELLPDYLRFVKGVVDCEDLPLNVSREFTQNSPLMQKIKSILVSKILQWLEDIATKSNELYLQIYKNFSSLLKTGINSDYANTSKVTELLRFETSKTNANECVSLKEYSLRMKGDQKDIYYIFGAARELLSNNPNLEYFKKNEIEVLFLTDPVDVFCIPYIHEYDGKHIVSIDKADIQIDEKNADNTINSDSNNTSIISIFKDILGDKVEDVIISKRLVTSPVTLVVGKSGMDPQMEKVMTLLNKDFQASKRILEINPTHPLLQNLERIAKENPKDERLSNAVYQLFESAMLIEGQIKDPNEFVQRMVFFMTDATK